MMNEPGNQYGRISQKLPKYANVVCAVNRHVNTGGWGFCHPQSCIQLENLSESEKIESFIKTDVMIQMSV